MNRRELLIGLGIASLSAAFPRRSRADSDAGAGVAEGEGAEHEVEYLFVQSAHEASLADGRLTLKGVGSATLYFSDRPEHIVGHAETDVFVANWDQGEDSFGASPPNAVLSILTGPMPQEIVVVLESPVLEAGDLTYDVDVLEGNATASGGASSLFIDTIGNPMSPHSVAGHHRRVRHRHRRRRRRAIH
jgi:hypothetical protein